MSIAASKCVVFLLRTKISMLAKFLREKKNHFKYLRTGWNNSKMQVGGIKWHSKGTKHSTLYLCLTLNSMNHLIVWKVCGGVCAVSTTWIQNNEHVRNIHFLDNRLMQKIKTTNLNPWGKDCKGWLIRSETLGLTIMLETEILKAKAIIQENWHLYLYFFYSKFVPAQKSHLKK